MAKEERAPSWRNFAAWSAMGAVLCAIVIWGSSSILHEEGVGAMFRSSEVMTKVGLAVIFAAAVVGFSSRKQPVSLRHIRNFLIINAVAVALFVPAVWGFSALADTGLLGAMGSSEWAAAGVGLALILLAFFGTVTVGNAHMGATFLEEEVADDLRDRGRLILCSLAWMAASGLLLIVLGVAGPGGMLSPGAALAGALILSAVLIALGIAAWRLSDELARTLANESGNMAFYLIQLFGGGWAMLAHLGFVPAPAPLDWLTMFSVLMFAASFIAAGRRKLLTR